jgi:DNA mismatch repair protein MSH5
MAMAITAKEYDWTCPLVHNENEIIIRGGRHPLQEACVDQYISNDTVMAGTSKEGRLHILTGPNNSGKVMSCTPPPSSLRSTASCNATLASHVI